jgi:hypothetical protein
MANGFEGIEEERVESLGELLDRVTPREHDPVSGRIRDPSVYRGSGSPEWPLLTSLDRLGGAHPPPTPPTPASATPSPAKGGKSISRRDAEARRAGRCFSPCLRVSA